jgi:carbon-monoxide dehydrogenase large subunit
MSLKFEPRDEDPRLLTGAGRFVDDEREEGEVHGVFVRSPHAFAGIRAIDSAAARALPGVPAVLTAADMERAGVGNVTLAAPVPNGAGMVVPHRPALAGNIVRHVGDPVALVVADTEAAARDAAELVAVDYDPRQPVVDVTAAALPQAPQIWPEAPGNVALDWPGFAGGDADRAQRADDLPDIISELRPVPSTTNALGVKGVGEAGTTASLAAVIGAVADALP